MTEFPICENCKQRNSKWHVVDEDGTGAANDYWLVCDKCVADIGSWAPPNWKKATDNQGVLLWTRL